MNSMQAAAYAVSSINQKMKDPASETRKTLDAVIAAAGGSGGAVSSVVGQTGAVTGTQILADAAVVAALGAKLNASDAASYALKADVPGLSSQGALSTLLRPTRWTRVYRVNAAGTDGAYTTIGAAISAANTAMNTAIGGNFDRCPYFRALVLVDPGTYNENLSLGGYVDVVGSSGNQGDVTISWAGANAVIEASGTSSYLANLTLQFGGTTSAGGTYALHSDAAQPYPSTLVCDNVWFESTNPNRPTAMGIGTAGGQTQFFNNCTFKVAASDAINFHNTASQKLPSFAIFNNCTVQGTPGRGLSVTDLGSTQQDIVMWIGGTLAGSTVKADLLNNAATKTLQLIIDPATATSAQITSTTAGYVLRSKGFPVAPVGGMSEAERGFFYPVKLSAPGVTIGLDSAPDAVAAAPTAGRVYYYPIQVPSGMQMQSFRVPVVTAAGTISAGLMKDDGTGKPGGYLQKTNATTATAGTMTIGGTISKRTLFPGYSQLWLAICASSSSSSLVMSNMLSTLTPCYYQDVADGLVPITATPVLLTAGTPVPLLGIISL